MPTKPAKPPPPQPAKELETSELLAAEYAYIGQTAFQANEDRTRVLSYYLVTVASLIGAILSAQFSLSRGVELAFAGLFALLAAFGALTLLQLIQLRKAWTRSVLAMGKMKEFIIAQKPDLAGAYQWRLTDIPEVKTYSITYLQALQVALLSAVALACALYFFLLAWNGPALPAGLLGFVLALIWQVDFFRKEFHKITEKPKTEGA